MGNYLEMWLFPKHREMWTAWPSATSYKNLSYEKTGLGETIDSAVNIKVDYIHISGGY